MILEEDGFKTDFKTGGVAYNELFHIKITQESDVSVDGGYTFEEVTNGVSLNITEAGQLLTELKKYINEYETP